ncbi:MAG: ComEC/Rec2 family competence protein, partial [Candidatus Omnitrophica bacterium]|nr:ComEC/Rec2 family competence protein [Candidatus Omnitrophota bacterium]
FLFLSIISLGSLLYLNSNIFPSNHISHFLGKDKVKAEIIGIIKSPAEARGVYYGKVSSRYVFEIEAIRAQGFRLEIEGEWQKIDGLALIRIQTEKDYQYGDRLIVKGTIKKPFESVIATPSKARGKQSHKKEIASSLTLFAPRNDIKNNDKSRFNYRTYLENQNIFAIINASEKNVTLLSHNYKSNPILRYAYLVRERIKNQFLEKMPLESGAFLRAILLGDRSELPKKLNESFRNSGTMHILAISGLNVALMAAAFLYFFKLLRIRRKIYYTLTMLLLVFLMILTGSSASVVRATIMCIVFLAGLLLGRPVDAYNSLGAAAFFILIINPKDIFDVGFQLSFIAVLSMVYLAPKLMHVVKKDWNFYVRKYLLEPFAVSVSATLGTFPFILYYFKMATPIAVVSNILIVPLMFILMIGGMCFIALSWVSFIGGMLSYFNDTLANIIFFLAEFFANVRFGHFNA